MSILGDSHTKTIWHMAFTIPDIEEGIRWYCDVLGCRFCQRFAINVEDGSHNPGFIFSFAGHHVSVLQGPTSVDQPDSRLPRHNGPVFLDRDEYFEVVEHCKNHPEINVIDSKYNFLIPKRIDPAVAHLHGQNVRCHRTTIKDPWNNWIEFKFYSYEDEIHAQNLSWSDKPKHPAVWRAKDRKHRWSK